MPVTLLLFGCYPGVTVVCPWWFPGVAVITDITDVITDNTDVITDIIDVITSITDVIIGITHTRVQFCR